MKLSQIIFIGSAIASASSRPLQNLRRQDDSFDGLSFDQIDALTPQFGHEADVNPTGTGDCDGAVNDASGNPVKVPCDCPPDRTAFIQSLIGNLNAGQVINNPTVPFSFPTDNSTASIQARFGAASVTLQNFNGSGKGCPQSSTTWTAQLNAILAAASSSSDGTTPATSSASDGTTSAADAGTTSAADTVTTSADADTTSAADTDTTSAADTDTTSAADAGTTTSAVAVASTTSAADPSTTSTTSGSLSTEEIDALAPDLGFQAGVNPTGTGDCDGAVNGANGEPVEVPCACPPDRDTFIQALSEDVAAGHAVNNPSVPFSFPTDNSTASQIARVQASLVALQNLNGTGQGCPAASTTLSAQLTALQAEQ